MYVDLLSNEMLPINSLIIKFNWTQKCSRNCQQSKTNINQVEIIAIPLPKKASETNKPKWPEWCYKRHYKITSYLTNSTTNYKIKACSTPHILRSITQSTHLQIKYQIWKRKMANNQHHRQKIWFTELKRKRFQFLHSE